MPLKRVLGTKIVRKAKKLKFDEVACKFFWLIFLKNHVKLESLEVLNFELKILGSKPTL